MWVLSRELLELLELLPELPAELLDPPEPLELLPLLDPTELLDALDVLLDDPLEPLLELPELVEPLELELLEPSVRTIDFSSMMLISVGKPLVLNDSYRSVKYFTPVLTVIAYDLAVPVDTVQPVLLATGRKVVNSTVPSSVIDLARAFSPVVSGNFQPATPSASVVALMPSTVVRSPSTIGVRASYCDCVSGCR